MRFSNLFKDVYDELKEIIDVAEFSDEEITTIATDTLRSLRRLRGILELDLCRGVTHDPRRMARSVYSGNTRYYYSPIGTTSLDFKDPFVNWFSDETP